MSTSLFDSIIDASDTITLSGFFICTVTALFLGLLISIVFMYNNRSSKGFVITLSLMPAIVSVVIMMVSGSLGASVAVAGAFSLTRFRSAPGTAKEICAIFLVMAVGLACGRGYVVFAFMFTLIMCLADIAFTKINGTLYDAHETGKTLRVTVPEDLEYDAMFKDIFEKYTDEAKLIRVKTTNLGSLNALTYSIQLKASGTEKKLIDALRTRNGNLEISISQPTSIAEEL